MKIGLIGVGRLGICFSLLLEHAGYEVIASDVRESYVNDLNQKIINTSEPFVQDYLSASKNFKATRSNLEVIRECDIIYTLVATPSLPDGSYDISSIWNVVRDFQNADFPVNGKSLVVGCTTNPGDCEKFQEQLQAYGVDVFYNPEFIAQGSIIRDLQTADMVLIGGRGNHLYDLTEIYLNIQDNPPKVYCMSTKAAELTKIAVNCFLTTKISYANMVGQVLALSGMEDEISHVLEAIGSDTRVGNKYMRYGFGFGGPCLPRDNRAFGAYMKELGLENNLGSTTDDFNNQHAKFLFDYFVSKNIENLPFYFDYISYKKGTDILTESQQYRLCIDLLDHGYTVYVSDVPDIVEQVSTCLYDKYYDRIRFIKDKKELPEKVFKILI
jgi:nucleotide sugar dehydrogenase